MNFHTDRFLCGQGYFEKLFFSDKPVFRYF